MRVSPTPEQLNYLSSLGLHLAPQPPTLPRSRSGGDSGKSRKRVSGYAPKPTKLVLRSHTLRNRARLGLAAGLCGGAIGLLLGGFFGVITHGLLCGMCIAACTAIGWLGVAFCWSFGWKADKDLTGDIDVLFDGEVGIEIAVLLALIAFVLCFFGMIVFVTIDGSAAARAWIRGTLLVIWGLACCPV